MRRCWRSVMVIMILSVSSLAYSETIETVLVPPKGTLQAGEKAVFSLLFANPSGRMMTLNVPEALSCQISADGRKQSLTAVSAGGGGTGKQVLPGQGFMKHAYVLPLPRDISGYVNFEVEKINVTPAVLIVQAAAAPPQSTTASAEAAEPQDETAVDKRLDKDASNVLRAYTLMPHRPNYILLGAYNSSGYNPEHFRRQYDDETINLDDTEVKFQISIKMPLAVGLFKDHVDIYAAYTNRSFWQLYNSDISSPFRETNHEPEVWFQIRNDWELFGIRNSVNAFGFNHQSNGRGGVLSRSWNRLFASFVFDYKDFVLSIKPWYRLPEDDKDDDNPDITDYLGHYEVTGAYNWNDHTFSLMSRNNIESGFEKGAIQATWSFPLWNYPYLKGYFQWFNGYGESLIDYNQHSNSFGLGFAISDFL